MRKTIINLFLGKFFIEKTNRKNIKLIVFIFFLSFVLISLSHFVDSKIYKITSLSDNVLSVESKFISQRKTLMNLRMESSIRKRLKNESIYPSLEPPTKIIIYNED